MICSKFVWFFFQYVEDKDGLAKRFLAPVHAYTSQPCLSEGPMEKYIENKVTSHPILGVQGLVGQRTVGCWILGRPLGWQSGKEVSLGMCEWTDPAVLFLRISVILLKGKHSLVCVSIAVNHLSWLTVNKASVCFNVLSMFSRVIFTSWFTLNITWCFQHWIRPLMAHLSGT